MPPLFRFFSAAEDESIVYGSERPGYGSENVAPAEVERWLAHMRSVGVQRVCCLLTQEQLAYYDEDLLETYHRAFGEGNVCWAPVEDYSLSDRKTLTDKILPFLLIADRLDEPVVVHCSGGLGRTGHILAAWLAAGRGMNPQKALETVSARHRNPMEAVQSGGATLDQLLGLLESVRRS